MNDERDNSQAVLRKILDTIPQSVFWKDRDGVYLGCNQVFAKTVGLGSPDEIIGKTDFDLPWPKSEAEAYRADDAAVISRGQPKLHIIEQVLSADGKRVWADTCKMPLLDERGNVIGVLGVYEDFTERRRVEEELVFQQKFSSALLETMPAFIYIHDLVQDRNVYTNRNNLELLGYTAEQIKEMGSSVMMNLFHPDDVPRLAEHHARCAQMKDSEVLEIEYRIRQHDGQWRWMWSRDVPFTRGSNGLVSQIIGSAEDITERKRAEEERAKYEQQLQQALKLESLGILAGGIAHDFNNLTAGIFGYIERARQYADDHYATEIASNLDKAMQAFDRARALTRQLLTFSRGGAPVTKLTDLSALLRDAASIALSGSNVRAEFDIAEDLWLGHADRNQLMQVVDNILINARDVMPEGGIISIRAENLPPEADLPELLTPGRHVRISIKDQGPGIAAEHVVHIFDPFFTTKEKGHGLGLSMAYSIIKQHGGLITAESQAGEGSTFRIFLPATLELPEQEPAKVEAAQYRGKSKILVMDDEPMILELLTRVLEDVGYSVVPAAHGEEAIRIYQEALGGPEPVAAAILDLTVRAGIGGKETIKRLLEIDPRVVAIVSSGYSDDPVLTDARTYGFKGVIQKPYKKAELIDAVVKVLSDSPDRTPHGH